MDEPCYLILRQPKSFETLSETTLKKQLESNDPQDVREALEFILQSRLDVEKIPQKLLMPIINRYQMNQLGSAAGSDKKLKKLLYLLWECLPKRSPDGKFLSNLVMVCGAFDKDLKHPNQFICGSVLRLLSKTQEAEFIMELTNSIDKCLDLSHSYQRRNAVLCIAEIYKNFPDIIPNAVDRISEFLVKETDEECKKAALHALIQIKPERVKEYLDMSLKDLHCINSSLQVLFVQIIQKNPDPKYISVLNTFIKTSPSPSTRYQAATALMKFNHDFESIKTVAGCFIDICSKESDNNVKLFTLDSLVDLRKKVTLAERYLRNSLLDILPILQTASDIELRQRIIRLSIDLVSPLTVNGLLSAFNQEIKKVGDLDVLASGDITKYRRFLIENIHQLADKYPKAFVEEDIINTLFNLLTCSNIEERTSSRLILFLKVFMVKNPTYVADILQQVQRSFNCIKDNLTIHKGFLWLMGEFSETAGQIEKTLQVFKESIGPLPIGDLERKKPIKDIPVNDHEESLQKESDDINKITKGVKSLVTADGTYATQSAIAYQGIQLPSNFDGKPLRAYLIKEKSEFTSVLAYALVKMAYRYAKKNDVAQAKKNKLSANFMLLLTSIQNFRSTTSFEYDKSISENDGDQEEQFNICLKILNMIHGGTEEKMSTYIEEIFLSKTREYLVSAVKNLENEYVQESSKLSKKVEFDDLCEISFFSKNKESFEEEKEEETDTVSAIDLYLRKIYLTGNRDPILTTCEFDISQFCIGMKIELTNQTDRILENVTVEFSFRGDNISNKIGKPKPFTLPARGTFKVNISIKVMSTESRKLLGSVTFDEYGGAQQILVMDDININFTDYIRPAPCSNESFKEMWKEYEWENKVSVKTKKSNPRDYLNHLIKVSKLNCITPEKAIAGDCSFLCANLYGKSIFCEDALVNLSVEKQDSSVSGHVKIRSRSQGLALSLGEKIAAC